MRTLDTAAGSDERMQRPRGVHLVGSIPLGDASEVFRTVAPMLGDRLCSVPDGETGKRLVWSSWTRGSYYETPGLEVVSAPDGSYTPWDQVRLVVEPEQLVVNRLGFADAALESYGVFADLKAQGIIPGPIRFQVCLPTPTAPMIALVEEGSRAGVEPAQARQLLRELQEIVDGIPHQDLAIQWDVCQDVGIWEGVFTAWFDDPRQGVIDRIIRLAGAVPAGVEMGFHLCYGDFGHQHYTQPEDARTLVEMSNAISASVARDVNWIHAPVPRDRDDDSYFAPFEQLHLQGGTRYYLGLIHYSDGLEGARCRLRAARGRLSGFGVATECGFGRRERDTIEPLLNLHTAIADPVT